jgi:addiction module HigA family antidote
LEPLNIGITQAASALGISRKTLSKIVNERGAITPDMALRLARALDTTPELWLNLQRTYAAHDSEDWRGVHALVASA